MVAGVGDRLDPDHLARLASAPPADAGDEAVAAAELGKRRPGVVGDGGLLGPLGDRGKRPVDVGEDRSARGIGADRSEHRGQFVAWHRHSSIAADELPHDEAGCVIGTAAGVFSGLFGVGGGTVIVPLLILWFGYGEREATGTSLAAIVVIAALAAVFQAPTATSTSARRRCWSRPAVGGVVLGTALQQRISRADDLAGLRGAARRRRGRAGDPVNEVLAMLVAAAGGFAGGLIGVGGGILFVPALTIFLDLSQVEAEATSLLVIIPVALAGALARTATATSGFATGYGRRLLAARRRGRGRRCQRGPPRALELGFAALALYCRGPRCAAGDAPGGRAGAVSGLRINRRRQIPLDEIELRASRSSGPGGQHANVTASRIEAVFEIEASAALSEARARASPRAPRREGHGGRPGRAQPGPQPRAGAGAARREGRRGARGPGRAAGDEADSRREDEAAR